MSESFAELFEESLKTLNKAKHIRTATTETQRAWKSKSTITPVKMEPA
jgi:hypothetical protein